MSKKKNAPIAATSESQAAVFPPPMTGEITDFIEVISSQLISFVLPPYADKIKSIDDVTAYGFEMGVRPQVSPERFFRLITDIDCTVEFNEGESVKASAQSITVFKVIAPLDKDKRFKLSMLPYEVIQAAASIAHSTTRGLILAKSGGTILQNAILPIVTPSELVKIKSNN